MFITQQYIEEKVLTTKDRKRLHKQTFCGPNRSFPVNDKQHVISAKVFLKRSKYTPEQKAKIKACINRKAKKYGVDPIT